MRRSILAQRPVAGGLNQNWHGGAAHGRGRGHGTSEHTRGQKPMSFKMYLGSGNRSGDGLSGDRPRKRVLIGRGGGRVERQGARHQRALDGAAPSPRQRRCRGLSRCDGSWSRLCRRGRNVLLIGCRLRWARARLDDGRRGRRRDRLERAGGLAEAGARDDQRQADQDRSARSAHDGRCGGQFLVTDQVQSAPPDLVPAMLVGDITAPTSSSGEPNQEVSLKCTCLPPIDPLNSNNPFVPVRAY